MELICTACDGLGEERRKLHSAAELADMSSMHRQALMSQNVAGWDLNYAKGYMSRICESCNGEGFRPSGASVPPINADTVSYPSQEDDWISRSLRNIAKGVAIAGALVLVGMVLLHVYVPLELKPCNELPDPKPRIYFCNP